jgi:hypothetical protein
LARGWPAIAGEQRWSVHTRIRTQIRVTSGINATEGLRFAVSSLMQGQLKTGM